MIPLTFLKGFIIYHSSSQWTQRSWFPSPLLASQKTGHRPGGYVRVNELNVLSRSTTPVHILRVCFWKSGLLTDMVPGVSVPACPFSPEHTTLLQPCIPATPACYQLFEDPGLPDPQARAHTILYVCSSHSSISIVLFSAHDSPPWRNLRCHQMWSVSLDMCSLKSCFYCSKHFSSVCFDIFICCFFD